MHATARRAVVMTNREPTPGAKSYPIRTVARLTGLTPDLIRAWERRHGVVSPVRGPRGARLYGDDDIARLEILARVVDAGRSIGDIAHLSNDELARLLPADKDAPLAPDAAPSVALADLLDAVDRVDMNTLENGLSDALLALGATRFAREVALPLLAAVGERWSSGDLTIGQEHLVSNALRGLLGALLRARGGAATAPLVLAGVSGERHEFGLLVVGVLAAERGIRVHLLGTDLPAAEIIATAHKLEAAVVGLSFVAAANRSAGARQLQTIESGLAPHVQLWVGGADAHHVASTTARAILIQDIDLLTHYLDQLDRRTRAAR